MGVSSSLPLRAVPRVPRRHRTYSNDPSELLQAKRWLRSDMVRSSAQAHFADFNWCPSLLSPSSVSPRRCTHLSQSTNTFSAPKSCVH